MLRRNSRPNILLHKATKDRQTASGEVPIVQSCTEPLLSKYPLSRISTPPPGGVFFGFHPAKPL